MALLHHVLVRLAAARCGYKKFTSYMILGDDIVIANQEVAIEYQNIITCLGVKISKIKSVISSPDFVSREFASKWVLNGLDFSPAPIGLLLEGSFQSLFRLTDWIQTHWYQYAS